MTEKVHVGDAIRVWKRAPDNILNVNNTRINKGSPTRNRTSEKVIYASEGEVDYNPSLC